MTPQQPFRWFIFQEQVLIPAEAKMLLEDEDVAKYNIKRLSYTFRRGVFYWKIAAGSLSEKSE